MIAMDKHRILECIKTDIRFTENSLNSWVEFDNKFHSKRGKEKVKNRKKELRYLKRIYIIIKLIIPKWIEKEED